MFLHALGTRLMLFNNALFGRSDPSLKNEPPSGSHTPSVNQLPWNENWKLDEQFFKDMKSWKQNHPDSTFFSVMEKVNNAVTMGQSFIEIIPDEPFPAGSLVKGWAYLLQLGVVRTIIPLVH